MTALQPTRATPESFLHRELILLLVLIGTGVAAFLATSRFASSNDALRRQDAAAWHARGRASLQQGDSARALEALRKAAHIDRGNRDIAITLATALTQTGNAGEATDVLESLRAQHPDDADVHMALARLDVERGDLAGGIRDYQDALDALWAPSAAEKSREVRTEFIALLLRSGQRARALSQTLVLAADEDEAPARLAEVAALFLQSGDPRRALDRYRRVLSSQPGNAGARAGAGLAAFELEDYAAARRYLVGASDLEPSARDARDIASFVLTADPLAPRLTSTERQQRRLRVLEVAQRRLQACPEPDAERVAALEAVAAALVNDSARARGQPRVDEQARSEDAVTLAARAERLGVGCGAATSLDRAVAIIARQRGLEDAR